MFIMLVDTRFKMVRQSTPITSVEIETSFSMYNNILSPKRQRYTEDGLSKYMVVHFFNTH